MKARIKDWDEAVRAALADIENWFVVSLFCHSFLCHSVFVIPSR